MKQQEGKLGIREYAAIAILMVGSKAMEDTPAMLYAHVKSAAWMVPIITGAIFFIPLYLLLKTFSVHQSKNLFQLIQHLFGKYIGYFICLAIFLINSAAISFDSRTYTDIIRTYYFTTTPNLMLYATVNVCLCIWSEKGNPAYRFRFLSCGFLCDRLFLSSFTLKCSRCQYFSHISYMGYGYRKCIKREYS